MKPIQDIQTRGMRNNNPLNIRRLVTNDWLGKITDSVATDMEFEQFREPRYGFRAAFILIHRYISQGYKTVSDIITRWAPSSDGNYTQGYIENVCLNTGFKPDTEIHKFKASELVPLVEAMFAVENGVSILQIPRRLYWCNELRDGYNLYVERFVN